MWGILKWNHGVEKKKQTKPTVVKKSPPEGVLSRRSSENDKEVDLEKKASATLSELIKEPAFTMKGIWT